MNNGTSKKFNFFHILNNDQGQVLLIVVLLLSIALGLSLGITSRVTGSISRTSTLDSFQKVTAAAEGGIELELNKTDFELLSSPNIVHEFSSSNTKAVITNLKMTTPATGLIYENILPGDVITYSFVDFTQNTQTPPKTVCLQITPEPATSKFFLTFISRNLSPSDFEPESTDPVENLSSNLYLAANHFFDGTLTTKWDPAIRNCNYLYPPGTPGISNYISIPAFPFMLRLKAVDSEIKSLKIEIIKSTNDIGIDNLNITRNIPQGVIINSKGEFISGGDNSSREIQAIKFFDTARNFFDYGGFFAQ
jgi:hypothetical protein